jgi:HD-like signal output (HDOD) protein/uncharacterized protein (DUF983 family)
MVDETLWFEDDDGTAEGAAAASMTAMVAAVQGVCPFSPTAQRLMALAADPARTPQDAAEVLEADPALAVRVMRVVASPAYGLQMPCRSLRQAVSLLGLASVARIAAATAVLDLFPDQNGDGAWTLEHAGHVASLARHLATGCGLSSEEMFTVGLLHDVGKLMMLQTEPTYSEIIAAAVSDDTHVAERERYGFDHAVLAAHVYKTWRIASPLPQVVAMHHRPARAYALGGKVAAMVCLLRLCDWLAEKLPVFERPTDELVAELEVAQLRDYLELSPDSLFSMWRELRAVMRASLGASSDAVVPTGRASGDQVVEEQREAPSALCVCCKDGTWGEICPRCRGALCQRHRPEHGKVCERCEREYQRRRQGDEAMRRDVLLVVGLAAFSIVFGVTSVVAGHSHAASVLGGATGAFVLALLAVGGAALWRRWSARAAFLQESAAPGRSISPA